MGMVKIINDINYLEPGETLVDLLKDEIPYVLYFTASWCGPCRNISPYFENLKKNYNKIDFYKIDIDDCEEVTQLFNISSVPCFYFFKKNREYYDKCVGANTSKLSELLFSLNNLYINDVEPIIEEQKKDEPIIEEQKKDIENIIENNIIYYNDIENQKNYDSLDDFYKPNQEQNLEILDKDSLNIEIEDDLNKFFKTSDILKQETNNI